MTKKLSAGALAALLTASGPNAKLMAATPGERRELMEAGLATTAGNLTINGRMARRSAFEAAEDRAFG